MPLKDPRITVTVTAELHEALLDAGAALKKSRKKGQAPRSPAVLNALIVQVSTARGTFEHAQRAADAAAKVPADGVQTV